MSSLKDKAKKGVLWDLVGSFSKQGVTFFVSIFLARLLTPTEFGLVGMAMVFISIFQVFGDFGLTSALIQNKKNTSLTYSTIFFLNVGSGILLCILFQFLAPSIGNFYNDSEITTIVRWLSLSFIFSSLNMVQQTILRKNIDFKKLSIRTIIAQVVGGLMAIYFAYSGYGVYALVIQYLVSSFVNTIILWKVSEWYPKLEFSWIEVKNLMGFSSFMFLEHLVATFVQRMDVLFVGKIFSPATLGFYSRAESLSFLVTKYSSGSFTKVFFPVFSSLQDDPKKFRDVYFTILGVISFASFLITGLLVIWGETIILMLFGDTWQPSVLIFQIIILKAFSHPVNAIMINAFLGKGKAKENFVLGLFRKSFLFLPLVFGYFYGMNSFLIAAVLINFLLTIVNAVQFNKYLGNNSIRGHLKAIFNGAIPLLIVVIFFLNLTIFNWKYLNNITYSALFLGLYVLYGFLTKDQGLFYLIENGKSFIAGRMNKSIKS